MYYNKNEEENAKILDVILDKKQRVNKKIDLIKSFFSERNYIFAGLNARRVEIFKKFFGLGCDCMTLEEIGKEYGFSRQNGFIQVDNLLLALQKDPYYTVMLNYTDEDLKGKDIKTTEDIKNLYNQLMEKRKKQEEKFFESLGGEDLKAFICFRKVLNKNCVDVDFIKEIFPNVSALFDLDIDYLLSGKASIARQPRCRYLMQSYGLAFKDDCSCYTEWQQKCVEGIKEYGIDDFMEEFDIFIKDDNSISPTFREVLKTPITQLYLSARALNICRHNGIGTVEDLITKEAREFIRFRNMGKITFSEIKDKVRSLGFDLKPLGMTDRVWLDKLEYRYKNNINKKPENLEELLKFTNCENVNDVYLFEILDYDKFLFSYSHEFGDIIVKIGDLPNYTIEEFKKAIVRYNVHSSFDFDEIEEVLNKYGITLTQGISRIQTLKEENNRTKEKNIDDLNYYYNKFDEIINLNISQLGLEARTYNCLNRSGFETLGDVISRPIGVFSRVRNFGTKGYTDLLGRIKVLNEFYGTQIDFNNNRDMSPKAHIQNLRNKYINKCKAKIEIEKSGKDSQYNIDFESLPEDIKKYYAEEIGKKTIETLSKTPLSVKLKERALSKQQKFDIRVSNNPYREDEAKDVWDKESMARLASTDPDVLIALLKEKMEISKEQGEKMSYDFAKLLLDNLPNSDDLDM